MRNKETHNAYMRHYRYTHPEYAIAHSKDPRTKWSQWCSNLRLRYNVTFDWVGQKFFEQEGKCAICRKDIHYNVWGNREDKTFSIHIDHDHSTGMARGLLCQNCNIALGKFEDSLEALSNAYSYVSNRA